jgi:Protein of unknown function (DUF1676)
VSQSKYILKMKFIYSLTFLCIVSVAIAHSDEDQQQHQRPRKASYFGDAKYLLKTYQECSSQDLSTCLKLKLFTVVDRIARSNTDIKLYDGVTFVKEENVNNDDDSEEQQQPAKSESEIEASLPRSLDDKEQTLNQMIMDKVLSFFDGHTLKARSFYFGLIEFAGSCSLSPSLFLLAYNVNAKLSY